jgi:hypothetical protein
MTNRNKQVEAAIEMFASMVSANENIDTAAVEMGVAAAAFNIPGDVVQEAIQAVIDRMGKIS